MSLEFPGTDPRKLADRVALVTGTSRGIGKAIALAFAKEGAKVALNDIESNEETAEEIETLGCQAFVVRADVSKAVDVDRMVENVFREFGRIDILVNNAGVCTVCPAERLSEADWDRDVDIDLKGVFLCSQAVGKVMIKQQKGSIINIASMAGRVALPKHSAYCAAKAGVIALTKVIAIEWARYNIRVNAIAPGFVGTEMIMQMIAKGLRKKEEQEAIEKRIPLGRLATPQEIADLAVYLASDKSAYVTGETIVIDGGWLAYGWI